MKAKMEIPTIHVHTQCDKNTIQFAKFMWETMLELANYPDKIKLTAHCMSPTAAARISGWLGTVNSIVTPCRKGDGLAGSDGHGVCIVEALSMTGDSDIHIIADSDTVILAKGWDDYVRARLLDDDIAIIGSTYEEPGGICSGETKEQMYKKIPTVTWCALSPRHDWRSLNVLPDKGRKISIASQELSDIYNLPQGYIVFCDTGWQIPQYLRDHNLKYEGWAQLKPSRGAVILKGLNDYHEEYHANGVPFLVHHRGSMSHAYRGDKMSNQFYGTVDKYLIDEKLRPVRFDRSNGTIPIPANTFKQPAQLVTKHSEYVARGKEWLKVTFNGSVIFTKQTAITRTAPFILNFEKPASDRVGHVRVEGSIEFDYAVLLPQMTTGQYMVTVRNATNSSLLVNSISSSRPDIVVPAGKTWFVLVDVDGVQRAE